MTGMVFVMVHYTGLQWLLFFYIYCFFGWCFESAYVSFCQKRFVNRGFMKGPFLPIYGSGAVMMLAVSMPFRGNLLLTWFSGMIGATALEYVTGVVMEALFQVRYWDYSKKKFQYQGHICLSSSIAWGFLTIFMTEVIHAPIAAAVLAMPQPLFIFVTFGFTVIGAADFTLSFKAAMELRAELASMERLKEELRILQRRLDVLIAVADSVYEEKKQELRSEELIAHIRERLENSKEKLLDWQGGHIASHREELLQLRSKFYETLGRHKERRSLRDTYKRRIFLVHPTIVSKKFKDALEELKEQLLCEPNEK